MKWLLYVKQGRDLSKLPYKAGSFPFGPIFAFVVCMIIVLGQDYQAFLVDNLDWKRIVATYVGLPLFFTIWLAYKYIKRTKFVHYDQMKFPEFKEEVEK